MRGKPIGMLINSFQILPTTVFTHSIAMALAGPLELILLPYVPEGVNGTSKNLKI